MNSVGGEFGSSWGPSWLTTIGSFDIPAAVEFPSSGIFEFHNLKVLVRFAIILNLFTFEPEGDSFFVSCSIGINDDYSSLKLSNLTSSVNYSSN